MLDKYTHKSAQIFLNPLAQILHKYNIKADCITIVGFIFGIITMLLLYTGQYKLALFGLAINRIFDGLDGSLARVNGITMAGGFLDIILDFIFYAGFAFSFGLSNPHFLLPAIVLLFSFFGTGCSFLAFASVAAGHNLKSPHYPNKALYYIGGLTEGTETIIAFILMTLWPKYFAVIAYIFSVLCFITTITRIIFGYSSLRQIDKDQPFVK